MMAPAQAIVVLTLLVSLSGGFHRAAGASDSPASRESAVELSLEDARHLLARSGFGAAPADIARLRGLSRQEAVDLIVKGVRQVPDIAMPDWVNRPLPPYHARADMGEAQRLAFNNRRDAELAQLRQWWVLNMLQTSSPQTERLVLFWHDLFATNYHDLGKHSLAMARQNQTFRQLGFGSWETLLKAMIRDAALLSFLDAGSNHKASPNENLARELMELFVLGEGQYDETTVKNAARALTGHDNATFHDLAFRLKTWAQDRSKKQLFGQSGRFDGDDLVEILLQQDAAPKFLATRFWHAFVADGDAPEAWVDDQAKRFRQSGLDISALYRNVLQSEAFWDKRNRGAIIKSPVDLTVGTARSLEFPKNQWRRMSKWQAMLGMNLFVPPNVAGWKEGAAFVTPGHLLNRFRIVEKMTRLSLREATSDEGHTAMMASDMTSDMLGENGIGDNTAAQERSDALMMQGDALDSDASIAIDMAAEDYRGQVSYRISLSDGDAELWSSQPQLFTDGHDTLMLGRIESKSDLNWQSVRLPIPTELAASATHLRVHFLNDAADSDGDRNLYVRGVRMGNRWLASERGTQISGCVPRLSAAAGDLYCSGYIQLDLSMVDHDATEHEQQSSTQSLVTASAIHMQWGKANRLNGKHTIEIVLDDVRTPDQVFNHVRFSIEKKHDQPMHLLIDSFSCWPDCVKLWPECAWKDEHFNANRHVSLPWTDGNDRLWSANHPHQCQLAQLDGNAQILFSTLWSELPDMLALLKRTPRVQKRHDQWMPIIAFMEEQLQQSSVAIENTPYAVHASELKVDASYARSTPAPQQLTDPAIQVAGIGELIDELSRQDILVHQLLLPDLQGKNVPVMPGANRKRPGRYLKAALEHPLFQLK